MARVIAPNKEYAGVSAGVLFSGGEGHTDDPYLADWFRSRGYTVEEEPDSRHADQLPEQAARKPARRKKEG